MAKVFGGEVGKGSMGGYSEVKVRIVEDDELFSEIPREITVWASHMDEVKKLPEGFRRLAESDICKIEAMRHEKKPLYGVQWHPEVYHSQFGVELYRNFVEICKK
jgi:GMP synthase (glutamine-hydrolysing)